MQLLFTVSSRSRDHAETSAHLKRAFRPSRPVEDWLCLRPFLSIEFSHTERLKLPRLRLRGLDRRTSHTIHGRIADMKLEVLSLALRLDCSSCVLTIFSNDSGWEKMLGGLGAGGGEQPDHLRHRVKARRNWASFRRTCFILCSIPSTSEPGARPRSPDQRPRRCRGRDQITRGARIPHRLRGNGVEEPGGLQKWAGAEGEIRICNSRHQHFWSWHPVNG